MNHTKRPDNLEKFNKSFTIQAPSFESENYHLSKQEYLDETIRRTDPSSSDSILEVAAGTCVCGRALATLAGHVVCLDATEAMLEEGKAEAEKNNITNITFIKGFAEDLPFLDSSFDIVISRLAFHHFTDTETAFHEMVRVLKNHGKLVLIDMIPGDESLREEADRTETLRDPSHVRCLSLSEMRNLYEKNGLSLTVQQQTDFPVSTEPWMELTKTPEETRKLLRSLMRQEIEGGPPTGFFPYLREESVYFDQHWIFNLGVKL